MYTFYKAFWVDSRYSRHALINGISSDIALSKDPCRDRFFVDLCAAGPGLCESGY